jgi:hypothetical protein
MYTTFDIYTKHKIAQAISKGKGYRLPKDWEVYWNNKVSFEDKELIQKATDYFNTKWSDLNIDVFMSVGFEIYKNFKYQHFFEKKVIKNYIARDKNKKYISKDIRKELVDSLKYVLKNYENILSYCEIVENNRKKVIDDYIKNNISASFLCLLIKLGIVNFTEDDKALCPYIKSEYKNIKKKIDENKEFVDKIIKRII